MMINSSRISECKIAAVNIETEDDCHINRDSRVINYLRISVTDRCNLACRYCVPKEKLQFIPHADIARYEEIYKIAVCASELGITKLRITGGEPLVRKGVLPFIESLFLINGIREISITTNGVLLEPNIKGIVESGINRVNISLDTLEADKFRFISGRDCFDSVWRGIISALDNGLSPVKLNAVILRGINDDEIESLAGLSLKYPFHVRFIEYMPMGNSAVDISRQVLVPEIRQRIQRAFGALEPVNASGFNGMDRNQGIIHNMSNDAGQERFENMALKDVDETYSNESGPAKRYRINGGIGEIGFISPVSSHFCNKCNRLRLTSTGHLRPCLLNNMEIDLLGPLRQGVSDESLKKIIASAIREKPASHHLDSSRSEIFRNGVISRLPGNSLVDTRMSAIGG